jgi:hypothetical protein
VQDVGIGAARVTSVSRAENSPTVYLEFRGLRDAPHTVDKDTLLRVALSLTQAAELHHRVSELLSASPD